MALWTDEQIATAVSILESAPRGMRVDGLRSTIADAIGRPVTASVLCHAFQQRGMRSPQWYVGAKAAPGVAKTRQDVGTSPKVPTFRNPPAEFEIPVFFEDPAEDTRRHGRGNSSLPPAMKADEPGPQVDERVDDAGPTLLSRDPLVRKLVELTKRGPVAFAELCDRLDVSPKKCRQLVERAQSAGVTIDVTHEHVQFRPSEPSSETKDTGVAASGARQVVGVISDTHLGSKYCLRAQLSDFVHHAYDRGAREILHAGDVLDGRYRHGMFELTHSGIELQTQDLLDTLPRLPGLTYHGITGNHDQTFSDEVGMDPGDYIEWYFKQHGRTDIKFYGVRGAYLKIRGAIVELWHPKKSPGYSLSYQLQNHVRDYGVGQKPDILIAGHWHIAVYLEQRGVHALAGGTFQGGGSAFSKSLGGAPSIGGTVLSWEVTDKRTLRRFTVERSAYYEREEVRELVLA